MFSKFFRKKEINKPIKKNVLVAALLIHAAKIDENYTDNEKIIIKKAIEDLDGVSKNESDLILIEAEKKEQESNQIIEFTREIKNNPLEYRIKIIEILWKIVYSDGNNDSYETNLIRRVCGLLYVSDKDSGKASLRVKELLK